MICALIHFRPTLGLLLVYAPWIGLLRVRVGSRDMHRLNSSQTNAATARFLRTALPKVLTAFGSGVPLFQYRVSSELVLELQAYLRDRLNTDDDLTTEEAAAFVLAASHEFCHSYSGGPWKWETAIGKACPDEPLSPPALYSIVRRGLRYWMRKVYWNGRSHEYLFTIGREGGLPLALLRGAGASDFERFLGRLLRLVESSGLPSEQHWEPLTYLLPKPLQHPETLRLAGDLIDCIADARRSLPRDCDKPVLWLAEQDPNWLDSLPLQVGIEEARTLVRGLVEQRRDPNRNDMVFRATLQLSRLSDERWSLARVVSVPKRLQAAELSRLCGLEEASMLPPRLRISASHNQGTSQLAIATRTGTDYWIQSCRPEPLTSRAAMTQNLVLAVAAGTRQLALAPLPNGEAETSTSLPMAFPFDDEACGLSLAARGSHRTNASALILVLPEVGDLQKVEGEILSLGLVEPLGLRAVKLQGRAVWRGSEDRCTFATNSIQQTELFELLGRLSPVQASGSAQAWCGVPKLHEVCPDGHRRAVVGANLEWRHETRGASWQSGAPYKFGLTQLRLQRDGETLFRTRAVILPPDLHIDIRAEDSHSGHISVCSAAVRDVTLTSSDVTVTRVRIDAGWRLHVTTSGTLSELVLKLAFVHGQAVDVRVPFPADAQQFLDASGRQADPTRRLSLESIAGYRAVATSPSSRDRFVLEVKRNNAPWRTVAQLHRTATGRWELPFVAVLPALEAALAGFRGIDAAVTLRIARNVGAPPKLGGYPTLTLGWHEIELKVEQDGVSALIELDEADREQLGLRRLSDFSIRAQPLHEPGRPPISLQRIDRDSAAWFFEPPHKDPWLLTGWIGPVLKTRPRLLGWVGQEAELALDDDHHSALQRAMKVSGLSERRASLDAAIAAAVSRFDHPDWVVLEPFLHTLREKLPPTTYDVVMSVASVKQAGVAAVMRAPAEHFQSIWDGLELLGTFWQTVPLGLWLRVVRQANQYVMQSEAVDAFGGCEEMLKVVLPGLLGEPEKTPSLFSVLRVAANIQAPDLPVPPLAAPLPTNAASRAGLGLAFVEWFNQLRLRAEACNAEFPKGQLSLTDFDGSDAMSEVFHTLHVDAPGWAETIRMAPIFAAGCMTVGRKLSSDDVNELRFLRSFDEEWFDFAHALALSVSIGIQLERDGEYLERAEQEHVLEPGFESRDAHGARYREPISSSRTQPGTTPVVIARRAGRHPGYVRW